MTSSTLKPSPDAARAPSDTDSSGEAIYTPPDSEYRFPQSSTHISSDGPSVRRKSPSPLRIASLPPELKQEFRPDRQRVDWSDDEGEDDPLDPYEFEMDRRPELHRPTGGRSQQPLLKREDRLSADHGYDGEPPRPAFITRRSTFHSQSPSFAEPENVTRRKYIYAGFFLILSLVSFVVQTETAVYIQKNLGWKKAYCMLWLTHGSWSLLWPTQLLILRIQKRKLSWPAFWRRHKSLLRSTAQMVQHQTLHVSPQLAHRSPFYYILRTTILVSTALTFAGSSWYIAVDLTTPSDLTAIYNCSAFFAYVFSILLLKDKLRLDKAIAVLVAIAGVLIIAYGDFKPHSGPHGGANTGDPKDSNPDSSDPDSIEKFSRAIGNLIIGVGSVLYGLYEVLYKKLACPPSGCSPGRSMVFANTFGSCIGLFTLTVLWIPLPILHFLGWERFEIPRGQAAWMLAISTLSNAVFSGSFLVLMSLTSPVLSSVAALLTIFLVAVTDVVIRPGKAGLSGATVVGGVAIILAFVGLSWATYREMVEEQRREAEKEEVEDEEVLGEDLEGEEGEGERERMLSRVED